MADQRPADDASIPGAERLYIRIFPSPDVVQPAGDGGFRPNSGALKPSKKDKDDPISVDLGSLCTPEQTRDRGTNGNFHVAMITAAHVRELDLRITRDPVAEGVEGGPNPAHALVHGSRENENGDLTGGLTIRECEKLARKARFILITNQPAAG